MTRVSANTVAASSEEAPSPEPRRKFPDGRYQVVTEGRGAEVGLWCGMKSTGQNAAPGQNVPRDSDTADAEASDRRHIPGAEDRNALDEDYATDQAPLAPGSPASAQPPHTERQTQGQLEVGSGGDAARPGKEGLTGKPIPPRGEVRS